MALATIIKSDLMKLAYEIIPTQLLRLLNTLNSHSHWINL